MKSGFYSKLGQGYGLVEMGSYVDRSQMGSSRQTSEEEPIVFANELNIGDN
jgi:hypothetical protein